MKPIVTLLVCFLSFQSFSQSVMNLDKCTWINERSTANPNTMHVDYSYTKYCTGTEDTIINAKTYRILYYCIDHVYKGALRSDTGHVYFVPKNSINEMLLYDFTLNKGDSVSNFYLEGYYRPHGTQVTSVDTIWINGKAHRRVNLFAGGSGAWIEGIGCNQGLLQEPYPNINGYGLNLRCFSRTDTVQYPSWQTSPCPMELGLERVESSPQIEFYPNPVKRMLKVSIAEGTSTTLSLYDTWGKLLLSTTFRGNDGELDLATFPNGIYYLKVNNGRDHNYLKVIKS